MFSLSLTKTEKQRFFLVTLGFMCVTSAALVARTTFDTLFLSQFGYENLSYMYLGTAVVVSAVSFTYGTMVSKLSIVRLIGLSVALLTFLLLLSFIGLKFVPNTAILLSYFIGDLVVHVPMMLFWGFAVLIFNPREAKRLFGFVGAGGTLACIGAGFVIKPLSLMFGTPALVFFIIVLLGGFLGVVIKLSGLESQRFAPKQPQKGTGPKIIGYVEHIKPKQIQHLIALVFLANVVLALVDYQFKAGARIHYSQSDLAAFFGNFYAQTSVLALFIQLFLVHRILQKGGVKVGLALLPLGILLGSIGTLTTADFVWIFLTKFVVQTLLFTVDIAALQMLYLSIPIASRNQARAFADGITKPIAIAVAGGLLIAFATLIPLYLLALGSIILGTLWLIFVHINSKTYINSLINSLGSRKLDISTEISPIQDSTLAEHLKESLKTANESEIIYLLSIAQDIADIDWTPEFRALIDTPSPEIKIEILRYLRTHGNTEDLKLIEPFLAYEDPRIRCEAIRALANLGGTDIAIKIEPHLKDPNATVKASAIASLVNRGDLDQLIDGGIALRDLVHSHDPQNRIAAANALADIEDSVLDRSLITLLKDTNPEVRKAALEACRTHKHSKLIPEITHLLGDPYVNSTAVGILADFGPIATPTLYEILTSNEEVSGKAQIPSILQEMEDLESLPHLLKASKSPNTVLRHKALHVYASLLKKAPSIKPYLPDTISQIRTEIKAASHRQKQLNQLKSIQGTELLTDALANTRQLHLKNAFALLDAILTSVDALAVLHTIQTNGSGRNNALEVLDNVLPKEIKQDVLDFFEKSETTISSEKFDASLLEENDTWVLCGALLAAVGNKQPIKTEMLRRCLAHDHAAVRETTLYLLQEENKLEIFHQDYQHLQNDPDLNVRTLAKNYLNIQTQK